MSEEKAVVAAEKPEMTREIELRTPFDGWKATVRIRHVPARVLVALQGNDIGAQVKVVERLIVSHNWKDLETGDPITDLLDAPVEAIAMLVELWGEAVASVPNM